MSLVADMAAEGVPASIDEVAPGVFRAQLCHPDGALLCEHKACPTYDAAEDWLFANASDRHPGSAFARKAYWHRQRREAARDG